MVQSNDLLTIVHVTDALARTLFSADDLEAPLALATAFCVANDRYRRPPMKNCAARPPTADRRMQCDDGTYLTFTSSPLDRSTLIKMFLFA